MGPELLFPTKQCVACGEDLGNTAYVCSKCKEYQIRWRNELKYWAGIAGLIVLVSSGLAFSFGSIKFARDYLWPPALIVSELNIFGKVTVVNMSNQNAWIKYLRIRSERPQHDLQWDVNYILKPREMYAGDLTELSKAQFGGLSQDLFGTKQGPYAQGLDRVVAGEILSNMHRNRYVPVFLHRYGPEYGQVKDYLAARITVFDCNSELNYVFIESEAQRVAAIPCVGIVKERSGGSRE